MQSLVFVKIAKTFENAMDLQVSEILSKHGFNA